MGQGTMTALAGDLHAEAALGRHNGPFPEANLAHGDIRHHMQGEKAHRGVFFENTCGDHIQSALALLLRRLEEEQDIARKLLPAAAQGHGCAQKGSSVEIMTAGMHHIGELGADLMIIRFLNGQCVDIRPEGDGGARLSTPEQGDDTGFGLLRGQLQGELTQLLTQKAGGFVFPGADFRVPVDPVRRFQNVFPDVPGDILQVHLDPLFP